MDRGKTGEAFVLYLTYGSRIVNQTDSLYQTVNGLVGNINWGESLTIASYEFRGPNSFGARRRAASAWLSVETYFSQDYPTSRCFEACNLTQVLTSLVLPLKQESLFSSCVVLCSDSCSCSCAYGWNQYKSAQPITSMERKVPFKPHTAFA